MLLNFPQSFTSKDVNYCFKPSVSRCYQCHVVDNKCYYEITLISHELLFASTSSFKKLNEIQT